MTRRHDMQLTGRLMNRSRVVLLGILIVLTACAPVTPSGGVTTDGGDFGVEAHRDSRRGRPVVAGHVHNPNDRVYFEVTPPAEGVAYRVTVHYVSWQPAGGGGGGGM
jgi:hypothetical protein